MSGPADIEAYHERLHRSGWSIGEVGTSSGWLVTGTNGENDRRCSAGTRRSPLTHSSLCPCGSAATRVALPAYAFGSVFAGLLAVALGVTLALYVAPEVNEHAVVAASALALVRKSVCGFRQSVPPHDAAVVKAIRCPEHFLGRKPAWTGFRRC